MTVAGAASILRNFRQTETELGHCYRFSVRETYIGNMSDINLNTAISTASVGWGVVKVMRLR